MAKCNQLTRLPFKGLSQKAERGTIWVRNSDAAAVGVVMGVRTPQSSGWGLRTHNFGPPRDL